MLQQCFCFNSDLQKNILWCNLNFYISIFSPVVAKIEVSKMPIKIRNTWQKKHKVTRTLAFPGKKYTKINTKSSRGELCVGNFMPDI